MSIIQFNVQTPGLQGINPRTCQLIVTDNLATLTAAGYMNKQGQVLEGINLIPTDVINCIYSYNKATNSGTFAIFNPSISSNGTITLVEWANPGDVLLPVTSGDFAVFNGTSGQIKDAGYLPSNAAKTNVVMANGATIVNHIGTFTDTAGTLGEDAATAINGGNIQAGLSGTAGTLASYPATATKGSLIVKAVANTGNTNTTLSNDAMGQASVISIPDPGNAAGQLLVGATATPFVSGNFPQNSGTAGLMTDSGVPVSSIATTSTAVLLAPSGDQTITAHNLIVSQGNLTAGSSGHAGTLASFPGTATTGSLVLAAVANSGNTITTISNVAMGQASVVSIPDPGNAVGRFLVGATATPLVNGNFPQNSGTGGLVVDSGLAVSNIMSLAASNTMTGSGRIIAVKANGTESANAVTASGMAGVITTSSLNTAGGSSYAITWTNTYIATTSVVHLTIMGGTNTTNNITLKATAGSNTSTLTIYNNTAATGLNGSIFIGYIVM